MVVGVCFWWKSKVFSIASCKCKLEGPSLLNLSKIYTHQKAEWAGVMAPWLRKAWLGCADLSSIPRNHAKLEGEKQLQLPLCSFLGCCRQAFSIARWGTWFQNYSSVVKNAALFEHTKHFGNACDYCCIRSKPRMRKKSINKCFA